MRVAERPTTWWMAAMLAAGMLFHASHARSDEGAAPVRSTSDEPKQQAPSDPLLDDLNADLLPGLEPGKPAEAEKPAAGAEAEPTKPPLPLDQPAAGEDIGSPGEDPFLDIGRKMRTVEKRIASLDTAQETQSIQQEILDEIDRLISQCQKQCQGQGGQSGTRPSGRTGSRPEGASTEGATSPAAADSAQGVRPPDEATLSADERQDLVRRRWGHLPERVLQQMQSLAGERFLSQYEDLIDQYFKRLAEEDASGP